MRGKVYRGLTDAERQEWAMQQLVAYLVRKSGTTRAQLMATTVEQALALMGPGDLARVWNEEMEKASWLFVETTGEHLEKRADGMAWMDGRGIDPEGHVGIAWDPDDELDVEVTSA